MANFICQLLVVVDVLDSLFIFKVNLESEFKLLISGIRNAKLIQMLNIVGSDSVDIGRVGWALDAEHAQ